MSVPVNKRAPFIQQMFEAVSSPQELVDFIHGHIDFFIANNSRPCWGNRPMPTLDRVYITTSHDREKPTSLLWVNQVSNYHHAPIGKKTNWGGRNKEEPTNYPGWMGTIFIDGNSETTGDFFTNTGINAGGGSGGSKASYSLVIFAHDFKKMAYHEMLRDFEVSKKLDIRRIKHVLEISEQYVDRSCPRLNSLMEEAYRQNPEFHAQILGSKLTVQESHKKKVKL